MDKHARYYKGGVKYTANGPQRVWREPSPYKTDDAYFILFVIGLLIALVSIGFGLYIIIR